MAISLHSFPEAPTTSAKRLNVIRLHTNIPRGHKDHRHGDGGGSTAVLLLACSPGGCLKGGAVVGRDSCQGRALWHREDLVLFTAVLANVTVAPNLQEQKQITQPFPGSLNVVNKQQIC